MATRIAMVGMGSVGNGMLWSIIDSGLAEQLRQIDIYDPGGALGVGYPYSQGNSTCLVNRQARFMSVRLADEGDLVGWVGLHASSSGELPYLDRARYGSYLSARFDDAIRHLRDDFDVEVRLIADAVDEVWPLVDGAGVTTVNGSAMYDAVILTVGYGLPDRVRTSGIHPDAVLPYPTSRLRDRAQKARSAVIVGTGLAAVDSARVIIDADESVDVRFVSRSDIFPDVRAHSEEALVDSPPLLSAGYPATVEGLDRYLRDCVAEAGGGRDAFTAVTDRLRSGVAGVITNDAVSLDEQVCQGVVTSIANAEIDRMWQRMATRERMKFLADGHRLFQAMANPIPPTAAAALVAARESGRISSTSDWSILPSSGDDRTLVVDASNTWRLGLDTTEIMLQEHGFHAGTNGCGVHIGDDGRLDHATIRTHRVYATGMLRRGSAYYHSSLYKSLELGERIVRGIARQSSRKDLVTNADQS